MSILGAYLLVGFGVYLGVGVTKLKQLIRHFDKEDYASLARGFVLGVLVWPIMLAVVGALSKEGE